MLQKAAEGFSYLLIAKIFTKVVDFGLNNLVIRKIDPRIFGLTLYFNLLQNTILLWVKMCFKNSYLKRNIKSSPNDKVSQEETDQILVNSAKNLMTIGTYVTIFWALALYALWIYLYGDLDAEFSKATALVCAGAIMESVQDILVVKALLNFDYGLVAKAESIAISTKTIVLFVTIQFNIFPTLICFGLSNVAYGLSITIATYILNKHNSIGSIKDALVLTKLDPAKSKGGSYVHSDMLNMTKEMTLISFPKFLLQEIEKIILANINTDPTVNGEYMVVSNLGSMIPRYFYAPTEEVCYNLFAKLDREGSKSEEKTLKMSKNEIEILQNIFKIINILGSLIAVFGFMYASTVLDFLYGGKWSTDSCVTGFQLYSLYIYVMGINGVSESFFFSTVGEKYLQKYRYFIVFNTLIFVGASYFLGKFGLWGIVLANIISMLIRIMNCLYYIRINMDSFSSFVSFLSSTLPNKFYLIFLGIVLIIGKVAQSFYSKIFFRLLEAGALGMCTLGLIYKFHRGDIKAIMDKRKKKAE